MGGAITGWGAYQGGLGPTRHRGDYSMGTDSDPYPKRVILHTKYRVGNKS